MLLLESRPKHGGVTINRTLSQALGEDASWFKTLIPWGPAHEERAFVSLGESYGWINAIKAGLGMKTDSHGLECAEYAALVLDLHFQKGETPANLVAKFGPGVIIEP